MHKLSDVITDNYNIQIRSISKNKNELSILSKFRI